MRGFLFKLIFFLAISFTSYTVFSYYVLPQLLVLAFGINVEDQIDQSFQNAKTRDYDLLILGNSKLYCGVNPEYLSIPAYNFAHNNDNYNQMYHKLKWLKKQGKEIKHLVLGIDYFQFNFITDSRNYVYGKYLGEEYLKDYSGEELSFKWIKEKVNFLKPYKLKTLLEVPYNKNELKSNGQFVRRGNPGEIFYQQRQFKFLDIQINYFDMILRYCEDNNVAAYICMPPLQKIEYQQYSNTQIMMFDDFILKRTNSNVHYIDFSQDHQFAPEDFIDMSHLSQEGSMDFTRMIDKRINQLIKD